MEENKENTEFLNKLALITDAAENMFRGKMSVIFELKEMEYRYANSIFEKNYNSEQKQFKVDISGTDFIFLLDESQIYDITFSYQIPFLKVSDKDTFFVLMKRQI